MGQLIMQTLVRHSSDHRVFPVDPITFEPFSKSYYDPYCHKDPVHGVVYIDFFDWLQGYCYPWDQGVNDEI